jgi:hypothetical protein
MTFWLWFCVRKMVTGVLPVYAAWFTVAPAVTQGLQLSPPQSSAVEAIVTGAAILVALIDGATEVRTRRAAARAAASQRLLDSLIRDVLRRYVEEASTLRPAAKVRANLMLKRWFGLSISHHWGMDQCRDLAIRFRPGEGACGRAYRGKTAYIADYAQGNPYSLTGRQQALVDKDRCWFLSNAILSGDAKRVVGVLNLDSDAPLVGENDDNARQELVATSVKYARELLPLLCPEESGQS